MNPKHKSSEREAYFVMWAFSLIARRECEVYIYDSKFIATPRSERSRNLQKQGSFLKSVFCHYQFYANDGSEEVKSMGSESFCHGLVLFRSMLC